MFLQWVSLTNSNVIPRADGTWRFESRWRCVSGEASASLLAMSASVHGKGTYTLLRHCTYPARIQRGISIRHRAPAHWNFRDSFINKASEKYLKFPFEFYGLGKVLLLLVMSSCSCTRSFARSFMHDNVHALMHRRHEEIPASSLFRNQLKRNV